jgi:Flp pilus assembly protein TadD
VIVDASSRSEDVGGSYRRSHTAHICLRGYLQCGNYVRRTSLRCRGRLCAWDRRLPNGHNAAAQALRSSKNNALAHYHLGFAYGMVGRSSEEINEYRTAATLGLNKWDLSLNLGLAYADRQELSNAVAA